MIRVATLQFAVGIDVEDNLKTCLRMIDQAAEQQPNLIVLPEFCNRLSWYENQDEVWDSAVSADSLFLQAIADKARKHSAYIVVNCTVRRDYPDVTVTSFLYDDEGNCVAVADKQTLMGQENKRFVCGTTIAPVTETKIGRIGLYACRDGVTMETPRSLAIRGAQILCNSLNSFAFDEAELHIPVRAPENKVFVVSANKVGPLIPEHLLDVVGDKLGVPGHFLYGAGESQIVAPDGTVLAFGSRSEEEVVVAEFDPAEADNKLRPDGTDIMAARRPELYRPIATQPTEPEAHDSADVVPVAVFHPSTDSIDAVEEAISCIQTIDADVGMVVLPELFCFPNATITNPDAAASISRAVAERLTAACHGRDTFVCTSLVWRLPSGKPTHMGVLINKTGVVMAQPQLHRCQRHAWATLGDTFSTVDVPWGRIGMIVGDDSIYPETAKVLAIKDVDVIAIPLHVQEQWETGLGLIGRSAENRVCIVAATRPSTVGSSVIITQHEDFQIFTPWKTRKFVGTINEPIVHRAIARPGITLAEIHPSTARKKVMSFETDLIQGRAWRQASALTE